MADILDRLKAALADRYQIELADGELDFIFVISACHDFSDPVALLRNACSALEPDGVLATGAWLRSTSLERWNLR